MRDRGAWIMQCLAGSRATPCSAVAHEMRSYNVDRSRVVWLPQRLNECLV